MKRFVIAVLMLGAAGLAMAADEPQKPAATPAKAAPAATAGTAKAATPTKDKTLMQIDEQIAKAKVDKTKPGWRTTLPKPTVATFDPAHTYFASMVTNKGTMGSSSCPTSRRCT